MRNHVFQGTVYYHHNQRPHDLTLLETTVTIAAPHRWIALAIIANYGMDSVRLVRVE